MGLSFMHVNQNQCFIGAIILMVKNHDMAKASLGLLIKKIMKEYVINTPTISKRVKTIQSICVKKHVITDLKRMILFILFG